MAADLLEGSAEQAWNPRTGAQAPLRYALDGKGFIITFAGRHPIPSSPTCAPGICTVVDFKHRHGPVDAGHRPRRPSAIATQALSRGGGTYVPPIERIPYEMDHAPRRDISGRVIAPLGSGDVLAAV